MPNNTRSTVGTSLPATVRSILRGQALALAASSAVLAPAVVLVSGVVAPGVAYAQDYTSGTLNGRVVDGTGKPVEGASVAVTSAQGLTRRATTNASGSYLLPALPAGSYEVSVTKQGQPSVKSRVNIAPGGSTYDFNLGEALAEVLVSSNAVRDFTSTDVGLVLDAQQTLDRLPVGRSIAALVQLTPGATAPDASINASSRRNQSLNSLAGTSAAESVYYINGLNVTDQRTFLGYSDMPIEFLQTVETKSGGYQAEFGRGTGGIINMVTRSGTNNFEAGATLTWNPDKLREVRGLAFAPGSTNSPGQQVFNQFGYSEGKTYTLYAGGPIIKDKLFLFGIYEGRESKSWSGVGFSTPTASAGTQTQSRYNDPFWGAKLDYIISDNHRLEGTVWSDKTTTYYSPYVVPRSTFVRTDASPAYASESGGVNYIAKYTGVFTDWFTLSALYGQVRNAYKDTGEAVESPGILDWNGYVNARRFGLYNLRGQDDRKTYRVDADFYFDLKGKHHLRVGYDQEDLVSDAYNAYNGGAVYYGYRQGDLGIGEPAAGAVEKLTFANNGVFKATQTAAYLQDQWSVTDRLSLQLGVRWDQYDYKNIDGASYVKIDNQFAPRLGFTFDVLGDGSYKLYGSMGDYYLPIATNTSIRASSGEVYTDEYFAATRDASGNLVLDAKGIPVVGAKLVPTDYFSPPGAPSPQSVASDGLKPMYEREFSLGLDHKFESGMLEGWTGGVRLVQRTLESTIEDTAIGDAVVRYCVRKAIACGQSGAGDSAFSSLFPYVLINPGSPQRVYVDLQGDAAALGDGKPNPAYKPEWIDLTVADLALPKATRKYQAMELTLEKPFNGKYSLKGSYVWASSKGNYEGAVKSDIGQTDTSITQDFDHAALTLNAYGYLPNHRQHTFKVFGSWSVTEKLSLGTNITSQSGRKYGCIGYVPTSVDPLAPTSGTPSGWNCPVGPYTGNGGTGTATATQPTPRGSVGETPWLWQWDMNAVWNVLESERGTLTVRGDVFNVLDLHTPTRVVETGEIRRSATSSKGFPSAYFGMVRSYQAPRSVRLTVSYKY